MIFKGEHINLYAQPRPGVFNFRRSNDPRPHFCTAADLDEENSEDRVAQALLNVPRLGPGQKE